MNSFFVPFYRNISTKNKLIYLLSKSNVDLPQQRCLHFKFKPKMSQKQSSILSGFDQEIEETMKRIRSKRKIKAKRNKISLTMTTEMMMNKSAENDNPMNGASIPSGSPEELVFRRDGMSTSFLTTRMKILNTHFTRAVSEIFISNAELSAKFEQYGIRITQVRISSNNRILHIYWIVEREDVDLRSIANYLNANKGTIHELLIETNYGNTVPWIAFIYDIKECYDREIASRFNRCKEDLVDQPHPETHKLPDITSVLNENVNLADRISFVDPIENIPIDKYYEKMVKLDLQPEFYNNLRLRMPSDMPLDSFNLDYEFLMNKVLQNLHRTRAQQRLPAYDLNTLAEHLPPIDTSQAANINANTNPYNTEERIRAIKKFVALNKKKRNKIELKLKQMILQNEIDRMDTYEQLRDKLQESMSELHPDIETNFADDEYYDDSESFNSSK